MRKPPMLRMLCSEGCVYGDMTPRQTVLEIDDGARLTADQCHKLAAWLLHAASWMDSRNLATEAGKRRGRRE